MLKAIKEDEEQPPKMDIPEDLKAEIERKLE